MNTKSSPSRYRYCISRLSTLATSTLMPALKVLSTTLPDITFFSLVRTKAGPLPGLTCWNSVMVHSCPSITRTSPFLKSAVVATVVNLLLDGQVAVKHPTAAQTSTEWAGVELRPAQPFRRGAYPELASAGADVWSDRSPYAVVPKSPLVDSRVPHHVSPRRPRRWRWWRRRPWRRRSPGSPARRTALVRESRTLGVVAVIPVRVVAPARVPSITWAPVVIGRR